VAGERVADGLWVVLEVVVAEEREGGFPSAERASLGDVFSKRLE